MGYAAGTVQVAGNCFAHMLHLYKTGEVQGSVELIIHLRLIGAVGMAVGILLGGWRLVPVSGQPCSLRITSTSRPFQLLPLCCVGNCELAQPYANCHTHLLQQALCHA